VITVLVTRPVGKSTAYILVTDLEGKEISRMPIELNEGINEVLYDHGYNVTGTYIYSLYIDGRKLQSKQMQFIN
jgi:hypothetical protein